MVTMMSMLALDLVHQVRPVSLVCWDMLRVRDGLAEMVRKDGFGLLGGQGGSQP